MLKKPKLSSGFEQSTFKGKVREESQGMWPAHAQFSDWLTVG